MGERMKLEMMEFKEIETQARRSIMEALKMMAVSEELLKFAEKNIKLLKGETEAERIERMKKEMKKETRVNPDGSV